MRFRGEACKVDAYCRTCTRLITPARQRGLKMAEMRKAFHVCFQPAVQCALEFHTMIACVRRGSILQHVHMYACFSNKPALYTI